jgi:predicted  nucleic acid-binding Zn-ribbon protein
MYKSFFERDLSNLNAEKYRDFDFEKQQILHHIKEVESQINEENNMEENQKDYQAIGKLEKMLSDLKIELNTLEIDMEGLDA